MDREANGSRLTKRRSSPRGRRIPRGTARTSTGILAHGSAATGSTVLTSTLMRHEVGQIRCRRHATYASTSEPNRRVHYQQPIVTLWNGATEPIGLSAGLSTCRRTGRCSFCDARAAKSNAAIDGHPIEEFGPECGAHDGQKSSVPRRLLLLLLPVQLVLVSCRSGVVQPVDYSVRPMVVSPFGSRVLDRSQAFAETFCATLPHTDTGAWGACGPYLDTQVAAPAPISTPIRTKLKGCVGGAFSECFETMSSTSRPNLAP